MTEAKLLSAMASQNLRSFQLALISFSIFLVTIIVEARTQAKSKLENIERHQKQLFDQIDESFEVRRIGTEAHVNESIRESIQQATSVENTFLNMGGFTKYTEAREQEIVRIYESFLSQDTGNVWVDIVSVNEIHEFRHRRIFVNGKSGTGKHIIRVLRTSMPIVNFIIFKNVATGFKEVYFGWVNDKGSQPSQIFKSRNAAILSIFERHFDSMDANKRSTEIEVDYSIPANKRQFQNLPVDKRGVWVTTLFSLDGKAVNHAFIQIDFENGKAVVKGKLLKNSKLVGLNHTDTTRSGDQLYFAYDETFEDGKQNGLCVYTFKRDGVEDVIRGFLYENTQAQSGRLLGVRIAECEPDQDYGDLKIRREIANGKARIERLNRKS